MQEDRGLGKGQMLTAPVHAHPKGATGFEPQVGRTPECSVSVILSSRVLTPPRKKSFMISSSPCNQKLLGLSPRIDLGDNR